jgi:putative DNA primase/helicase
MNTNHLTALVVEYPGTRKPTAQNPLGVNPAFLAWVDRADEMRFYTQALEHARRAWPVFPCEVGGKKPLGRLVPRGLLQATTDPAQIAKWWGAEPDANIGIATGAASGFFVIDLDTKNDGPATWAQLTSTHGEVQTATVRTPTGGSHLYFSMPVGSEIKNSAGIIGPGVDVRGTGGYVVAAGSARPEGSYTWESSVVAEPPRWLVNLVTKKAQRDPRPQLVSPNSAIIDGQRNSHLTSLAGSMRRRGMTVEAIRVALLEENSRRCRPPLPEREVDGIAASVGRYSPAVDSGSEDKLTEAGAADRFVRLHGGTFRFDYRRSRWLRWDRQCWRPDGDQAVVRQALEFARQWQREALDLPDQERREAVTKFALRLERHAQLISMLALAKTMKPIADTGDAWDSDPALLCTPNGVIDLRTGRARPGDPDDRITMQTAVPYDPDAPCRRWLTFVEEVFNRDQELIDFVHRAIGYSMSGFTSEQVIFLGYGTGANGKGTLTNTIKRVLGDYFWNMPFATIEMRDRSAIPNDLAALVNRRFVSASETNDGIRLNEARVKALTGGDPITARFLHSEFFSFEPVAKFWLSVNHKPVVRDDSYGFWRRIRLIPFTQRFDVNQGLADELYAEAPGILAWCVRGCLLWQSHGLQAPASVLAATREYEQESDPLAAFLAEACDLNPGSEVFAKELFDHYDRWAEQHGLSQRERLSSTAFGRKVSERFQHERRRTGRVYFGVARRTV